MSSAPGNIGWPRDLLASTTAVVAGGGRGIGAATSIMLARAGAAVCVLDVDPVRAATVVDEINSAGGRGLAVESDLRQNDQVVRALETARMGLGTVNLLVNVAGGMNAFAPFKPLHQWNAETWDEIVALNLGYVFLTCRTILRGLLEAKSAGVIVNIASISGETSAPNHAPYGAAKAGLASLTRSLAVEYGGHGIRVNAVAPGAVVTPATANREGAMGTTPLGRHAVAEDIANAVIFLASPLSSFITGQVLLVDGGASSTFPLTTPSDVS